MLSLSRPVISHTTKGPLSHYADFFFLLNSSFWCFLQSMLTQSKREMELCVFGCNLTLDWEIDFPNGHTGLLHNWVQADLCANVYFLTIVCSFWWIWKAMSAYWVSEFIFRSVFILLTFVHYAIFSSITTSVTWKDVYSGLGIFSQLRCEVSVSAPQGWHCVTYLVVAHVIPAGGKSSEPYRAWNASQSLKCMAIITCLLVISAALGISAEFCLTLFLIRVIQYAQCYSLSCMAKSLVNNLVLQLSKGSVCQDHPSPGVRSGGGCFPSKGYVWSSEHVKPQRPAYVPGPRGESRVDK